MSNKAWNGKGSWQRPKQVSDDEVEDNWDLAFKRSAKNNEKIRHKKKLRKPVDYE